MCGRHEVSSLAQLMLADKPHSVLNRDLSEFRDTVQGQAADNDSRTCFVGQVKTALCVNRPRVFFSGLQQAMMTEPMQERLSTPLYDVN